MKLPFLKFYVRDWISDQQLRMCSLGARGLWLEMLCLMHDAGRYGYLETHGGRPFTNEELVRLTGAQGCLKQLMQELLDHGVPSVEDGTGTWYCRRMVKDQHKRDKCGNAGKKGGGNPLLSPHPYHPIKHNTEIPDTRDHISLKVDPKVTFKGHLYRSDINPPTLTQCIEASSAIGMPTEEVEAFHAYYDSQGWRKSNGQPVTNLRSALQNWKIRQQTHAKQNNERPKATIS